MPNSSSRSVLPRGVYRAPWLGPSGQAVFVAVGSTGRIVADGLIPPDHDAEPTLEQLRAELDSKDPPLPPLRLVS